MDISLAAVLALAASLRWVYIGVFHLVRDEAIILIPASRLARDGEWTWLAWNLSSWSFIASHSPLSVYLAAIPYLFSSDPRLGRLWMGLLGVVAVAIVYWTVGRYFGRRAALIAGLLFAAHASAVDWSRFVWNPHLAQPFIAGWLWTGLVGYYEGRRWAQIVHWLALSLAVQAHPSNGLLLPLSLLVAASGWLWHQAKRATFVRATLLGWALMAASLVPWGIGLVAENPSMLTPQGISRAAADLAQPNTHRLDVGGVARDFANLTGSTNRRLALNLFTDSGLWRASGVEGNWSPPGWMEWVFRAQAALTLLSVLILLGQGVRRPANMPVLLLAVLSLWPLAGYFTSLAAMKPYYMVSLIFGAVPSLGVVLARLADRGVWGRRVILSLVGIFAVAQSWLTMATVRDHYLVGNQGRFDAPLDTFLATIRTWSDAGDGREMIILAETTENLRREPSTHWQYWGVATVGYSARIVLMDPPQGVPIPSGGALVASTFGGQTIPALFGPGQTSGRLVDGQAMYRWVVVPQAPDLAPALVPETSGLFANGARVLGLSMKQVPHAGQAWPVTLLWQIERTDLADNYSFSVRLVGETGETAGQADGLSLTGGLWRKGDTVLNRFSIPVSEGYGGGGELRVQVWMYKTEPVAVVDEGGSPVAMWVTLVRDEAVVDQLGWFEYHPGGRYVARAGHAYYARLGREIEVLGFEAPQTRAHPGATIPVTVYWRAAERPSVNYRVYVHLRAADGSLWGQSDKENPAGSPTTHWGSERYVLDRHSVTISADIPPGQYQLYVGMWDAGTGQRLPAYDEAGAYLGDSVPLPVLVRVQP